MTKFVSNVPDEAIEKDAQALLAEYAHARGVTIEAPIAIDDIIEQLKIGIEFDDTPAVRRAAFGHRVRSRYTRRHLLRAEAARPRTDRSLRQRGNALQGLNQPPKDRSRCGGMMEGNPTP
jgi:hypothetical protein